VIIWKEEVRGQNGVLFRHLPGGTEGNHVSSQSGQPVSEWNASELPLDRAVREFLLEKLAVALQAKYPAHVTSQTVTLATQAEVYRCGHCTRSFGT
jgi:hypothetical protein